MLLSMTLLMANVHHDDEELVLLQIIRTCTRSIKIYPDFPGVFLFNIHVHVCRYEKMYRKDYMTLENDVVKRIDQ